jgi:hypothetical protein
VDTLCEWAVTDNPDVFYGPSNHVHSLNLSLVQSGVMMSSKPSQDSHPQNDSSPASAIVQEWSPSAGHDLENGPIQNGITLHLPFDKLHADQHQIKSDSATRLTATPPAVQQPAVVSNPFIITAPASFASANVVLNYKGNEQDQGAMANTEDEWLRIFEKHYPSAGLP